MSIRFSAAAALAAIILAVSVSEAIAETGSRDFEGIDHGGVSAAEVQRQAANPPAFSAAIQRAADNFGEIPGAQGETLMPAGTVCDAVEIVDGIIEARFTIPEGVDIPLLAAVIMENANAALGREFAEPAELSGTRVLVRQGAEATYHLIDELIPMAEPPTDEIENWSEANNPAPSGKPEVSSAPPPQTSNVTGQGQLGGSGQPQGALTGRTVYIYGGHGWTWEQDWNPPDWRLQRGVQLDINEDQGNVDQQNFLAHYLFNAGATVVSFRPIDYQTNEVVLDNTSGGVTWGGTWSGRRCQRQLLRPGFASLPFCLHNGRAIGDGDGHVHAEHSQEGFYPVYTWVYPSTADRVNQLYRINHTGGQALVRVNHRRVGRGWVWLGTYHFNSGSSPSAGSVVISNLEQAGDPGNVVIADAIRFGNGMGGLYGIDDDGDARTVSGYPREEEGTPYWIRGMIGVPDAPSVYASSASDDEVDSWSAPPRMAARMRQDDGQGSTGDVYLGFHSNAGSGVARGCVGLITGSDTANQAAYAALVADELDADCLAEDGPGNWPYTWFDRADSTYTGGYGEISNGYFGGEMDATIIEVAYHDNLEDSTLLREARVRNVIARACYHAIVQYFDQFDTLTGVSLLPEPPVRVRAVNNGSGGVTLSWQPGPAGGAGGDAATGYVVYRSTDGLGFGSGVATASTSTTINGLTANQVYHFRVAATNSGGESMPSEVLAVRVAPSFLAPVLIVNGYDRLDRRNNIPELLDPPNTADRLFLRRNNAYDYVIQHASAVAAAGRYCDSSTNEAVISGDIALGNYHTVIWILGEESTTDETFGATEQTAVANYITGGGHLFLSGAEIGWDLEAQGGGGAFYSSTLRGDYVGDDAGTYTAAGEAGSIFAGLGSLSFNSAATMYDPDWPDTLQGINGSAVCLRYTGVSTLGAGLQWPTGLINGRIVMLGFPFECITSASTRNALMQSTLDFFNTSIPVELSVFSAN